MNVSISSASESSDADIVRRTNKTRRLSDKVLLAFHEACDAREMKIARHLLSIADDLLAEVPDMDGRDRRREIESVVGAHFRLWEILHGA